MPAKTYLNLLVLLCVLCHGIIDTLSEKDIDESSELLIRQRRVINTLPGEDRRVRMNQFPYVIYVKEFRGSGFCVGVILTHLVAITAAKCVVSGRVKYRVYSGHAMISVGGHSKTHNITEISRIVGHIAYRPDDGIALIKVSPSFAYSINTRNIPLYEGPIRPGMQGTVAGWGCNPEGAHPGTACPNYLRSITVPIISRHDCQMLYLHTFPIVESDICTLDATEHKYCGVNDVGAPLVIEVNYTKYLVGIHLWNGGVIGRCNPDVFLNLQDIRYKSWIMENMHSMNRSV